VQPLVVSSMPDQQRLVARPHRISVSCKTLYWRSRRSSDLYPPTDEYFRMCASDEMEVLRVIVGRTQEDTRAR